MGIIDKIYTEFCYASNGLNSKLYFVPELKDISTLYSFFGIFVLFQ
jgi:hypothetical protein